MRLIDVDELINELRKLKEHPLDLACWNCACRAVVDAPTIDPVRHGKWIKTQNPRWPAHEHDKCSICGWWNTKNAQVYEDRKGHSLNYCPNCGTKMDGEE